MKKHLTILFTGALLYAGQAQYCLGPGNYYSTGGTTEAIITSDFNHDGVADLVTSGGGNVRITTGNGDGTFSSFTAYSVGSAASALCAADFNKDGNMDVATANTGSNDVTVLLGNGAGSFTTTTNFPVGQQPAGICTGDFDGDGNLDLAITCVSPDHIYILLGNGAGSFPNTSTSPSVSPYGICSGDFNGDSKTDLAVTDNTNGVLMIYTGVGNGTFTGPVTYGVGSNPRGVITTDYNADGKTDLCVVNRSSSNIMVFTNGGTGSFSLAQTMPTTTEPTCVTETSLNGDATPDYATSDYGVAVPPFFFSVMVNGSNSSVGAGAGMSPHGICSADFNGDGKKDLALACEGTNNVGIYLNTLPIPQIAGVNHVCQGSSTTLTASGASTYTWSSNAGSATTASVSVSPSINTTYTVTGSASGCGNTGQAVITVTANPTPSMTLLYNGSSSICTGHSTGLMCIGDGDGFTWMPGSLTATLVTVSPATTTIYTVTETNSVTGCSTTGTISVFVSPTPTVTINSTATAVCSGTPVTLSGNGATTYSWSSSVNDGVPFTPATTATYVVTGTAPGPCTNTASIVITVNATPTLSVGASPNIICVGASSVLSGSGALSYVWSSNAGSTTTNTVMVSPASTAVYTLTGNNGNGCSSTATTTLTVNPLPTVTANSSATVAVCAGTPVTLTGGGTATTYTWTGGITNGVSFPAVAQTYTVTGTDANNCSNTATITVNASTAIVPNICTVTVDSLSQNNVIVWDKTLYQNADTFFVYRDTANNNFAQIAALPYSALSEYHDTARSIGLVNGDPNVTTYHYKLAYRDSCGNMSPKSPYHGSIYQYNIGSLFIWNAYQIEGQPTPVPGLSSYSLKRDNLGNTGNFVTAASAGASSTSINDPQYGTYQLVADWRIETNWSVVCIPTLRQAGGNQQPLGNVVKSKSNITNNRGTTGVKLADKLFNIYPNPTNGILKLDFNYNVAGKFSVRVLSSIGQEVFSADFEAATQHQQIDLSALPEGIYLLQVNTPGSTSVKRIVKN